jgi:hypothetical protein
MSPAHTREPSGDRQVRAHPGNRTRGSDAAAGVDISPLRPSR